MKNNFATFSKVQSKSMSHSIERLETCYLILNHYIVTSYFMNDPLNQVIPNEKFKLDKYLMVVADHAVFVRQELGRVVRRPHHHAGGFALGRVAEHRRGFSFV